MGFRVPEQLATIIDFIRWGASRFAAAGLSFGHSYDNALDEATQLVLHALHLPHDLAPAYGAARLSAEERVQVMHLFKRRIDERKPACYLTGEAWFAGLAFKVDERVLVPRSPIAELIEAGFEPWLGGREVRRALDLCTGSGCIGIAMAAHQPGWHVDVADISAGALALARENVAAHHLQRRMRVIESDLYGALGGERYDLIVSNPPYVPDRDVDALPPEYGHEPALGLKGGDDGLDLVLRILAHAPEHLGEGGLLVVEVGDSEEALAALLPQVPFAWVEFKVGQMGVFVLGRDEVLAHQYAIRAELGRRGLA
ncbi:MAG: 50S ribosomal protein L3 N(5)-glutamine methyltransferase [Xanthomonadales bacterium]|nr:50S ribosomal protein L3 N(5)-glutamine methyltransferase [Xanthomonadales bacterium]